VPTNLGVDPVTKGTFGSRQQITSARARVQQWIDFLPHSRVHWAAASTSVGTSIHCLTYAPYPLFHPTPPLSSRRRLQVLSVEPEAGADVDSDGEEKEDVDGMTVKGRPSMIHFGSLASYG
jgi:hypothetical protein